MAKKKSKPDKDDAVFEDTFDSVTEEQVARTNREMLPPPGGVSHGGRTGPQALAELPQVQKVVLFGSVAAPLFKEVPRFREFRWAGVAVWHECKDVDLAVWVSDLEDLKSLQRARTRALNALLEERDIGVAHHQVDIFLFEPGSNRYLGRLCWFGQCPKGKQECLVPGCGQKPYLRQHLDFAFQPESLGPDKSVLLFAREGAT